VRNSFFWRIINTKPSGNTGEPRGAININGNYPVNVTDSTFIECSSTWGGGVCVDLALATLERCCGTNCSANNGGQFVQFGDDASNAPQEVVFFLTVLNCCPLSHSSGFGVIHAEFPRIINCTNSNFTACKGPGVGAVVCVNNTNSQCTCQFLTVVRCSGESGIDSKAGVSPLVEFCNVLNNSLTLGSLYTRGTGMLIHFCIFRNNENDINSSSSSCESNSVIEIVNCVFTTNVSLSGNCFSISGNTISLSPFSHSLQLQNPEFCTATPLPTPTRSRSNTPSKTRSQTAIRTESRSQSASQPFGPSIHFFWSEQKGVTHTFGDSCSEDSTASIDVTQLSAVSFPLEDSIVHDGSWEFPASSLPHLAAVSSLFEDSIAHDGSWEFAASSLPHPAAISFPLEDSIVHDGSWKLSVSSLFHLTSDFMHSDSFYGGCSDSIFLSSLFLFSDLPAPSVGFTQSDIWDFQTASDDSSDSADLSIGMIIGIVVGVLLVAKVFFGVFFLFRGRSRRRISISDSSDTYRNPEFSDSTLRETLFISSDTVTIDGMLPDSITTYSSEYPTLESLVLS
jgi:hypothetical protein